MQPGRPGERPVRQPHERRGPTRVEDIVDPAAEQVRRQLGGEGDVGLAQERRDGGPSSGRASRTVTGDADLPVISTSRLRRAAGRPAANESMANSGPAVAMA
jgi:hypothetical protein